jgi:hypothetical protein
LTVHLLLVRREPVFVARSGRYLAAEHGRRRYFFYFKSERRIDRRRLELEPVPLVLSLCDDPITKVLVLGTRPNPKCPRFDMSRRYKCLNIAVGSEASLRCHPDGPRKK